jgi:hypothetical protein
MLLKTDKTVIKSHNRICGFVSLELAKLTTPTTTSAASNHSPIGFTSTARFSPWLGFGQDAFHGAAGFVLTSQAR